jgi:hypothetical protein
MNPPEPADLETLAEAVSRLQVAIERLAVSLVLAGHTGEPTKPVRPPEITRMKPRAYLEA